MRITWTCTLRLRCQQRGSHVVSVGIGRIFGDYWPVYDGRHWTSEIRITWTCTLRLRCLQWGPHGVSVRVKISGDYWRVRDWRRNRTTNTQITWTCTLRLRCLLWGPHAVSVRIRISGDYWRLRNWRRNRTTKLKMRITWTCTLRMKSILRGSQRFMREETFQINCGVGMGWFARSNEIWIIWHRTLWLQSMKTRSLLSMWGKKSRDFLRVTDCETFTWHCVLGLNCLLWWILQSTQGKIFRVNRRETNCRNARTVGICVAWNFTSRLPWWFQLHSVTEGMFTEWCQAVTGKMWRRNGSS